MIEIMARHRIPYAATLSLAHRDDFLRKVRFARKVRGFRFLLMLSPCPQGWKSEPQESVELVREAVRCGLFPLYEVFDGVRYRINVRPETAEPADYLAGQRRYARAASDSAALKQRIHEQWSYLKAMETAFPAAAAGGADEEK
jgi:pyruvate ferredoxin oxidoreductase beta subunit/2-oxoisovalerate ferredoxin oxidoreductase beta subunit